jgi:hypothetical protein
MQHPEAEAAINKLISTPEGRAKLAAAMTQPLRIRRDYIPCDKCGMHVHTLVDSHDEIECLLYKIHES